MIYHIEDRVLTAQDTVVSRASMPVAQLPEWIASVYAQVRHYLSDRGVRADGPPFARYALHEGVVDVEAGFPVLGSVVGNGRITASRLPGGPAAVTTHFGRYEDIGGAHEAVHDWLTERGLEHAGPHWEVYYTNPAAQPDTDTWSTDVVWPYRDAAGRRSPAGSGSRDRGEEA
ncbi:GyrI-like domain-containing protein [Paractinoplanes ferrugineus]|uniref:Transcription activator effector-binding protein n=1 Tax=Paractinoplanes ferrugineus TaxID=113564 RepID=A0A919J645_9ACTN|nr:GyrI-like domain-containing protein [Actinoplanes ferrugineus]GIE13299.1 transcription activator effector-binding protein [Actinoplanes ferrugineus]